MWVSIRPGISVRLSPAMRVAPAAAGSAMAPLALQQSWF
jgi:hypothetical protein